MALGAADLLPVLQKLPTPAGYLVAYSGGLDSHVLLHAMTALRGDLKLPVRAIHVHHGLQAEADQWQAHCAATCAALNVALVTEQLGMWLSPGESVEAAAREARYSAIAGHLRPGEMLLTAQHRDDQAETLLLQLLRGAGVDGLAAMPLCREWFSGWQARPLLPFSRDELVVYAQDHALDWVEDPSNQDQRFDRNYLRHTVMPLLQARWPAAAKTLARSASHLASASRVIRHTGDVDRAACEAERGCLSVAALLGLSAVRRHGAIRSWLRLHGKPIPDHARLVEIDQSVLGAAEDASPKVAWAGVAVRRYRDQLCLLAAHEPKISHEPVDWPDQAAVNLPDGSRLSREPATQGVPDRYWIAGQVQVRWRSEGMVCKPRGRKGSRSFKKLCQELGIPPWQRDRVPLVYVDERLIAVADYCLCGEADIKPGDTYSRLRWDAD